MTVQELIDLLKAHDPHAKVHILTMRFNLHADISNDGDACVSGIDMIRTFPANKDIYIVEDDKIRYYGLN